jgi:hypothetical protein
MKENPHKAFHLHSSCQFNNLIVEKSFGAISMLLYDSHELMRRNRIQL